MKSKSISLSAFILLNIFIPFLIAVAQPDTYQRPALERLEQLRKAKLIEVLDLKEEEAIRFFARYKDFREVEEKLMKERMKFADDLQNILKSDGKDSDIYKVMDEIENIDKKILSHRWETTRTLHDILTAKQIGKLVLFEQKFMQEVRRALHDAQRERRGAQDRH